MEEGSWWAEMVPDALVRIFSHLSLKEMLTVVPSVCRSWQRVSQDAVCWQALDLEEWSRKRSPGIVERMVKMLLARTHGGLRRLSICSAQKDSTLHLVAQSAPFLQVLCIPYSIVTDDCVQQIAPKIPFLTFLDISGCVLLSEKAIEAFGGHCRSIVQLRRNMYPQIAFFTPSNDREALAIAQHMPQLKYLEMSYGPLTITGLKAVLDECPDLEYVDLRGCYHVNVDELFVKECRNRLKAFYPPVVENDFIYDSDLDGDDDGVDDADDDDDDDDDSEYNDDDDEYGEDDSYGGLWESSNMDYDPTCMMEIFVEEINGTLYFWPG